MTASLYATIDDLNTYGLPAKVLASVSAADKTAALTAASAVVDSYIGSRVTLPLSAWGVDITEVTAKIAAYTLLNRRGWQPGVGDSDQFRRGYDDAVHWLRDVSKGIASPYGTTQAATATTADATDQSAAFVVQPAGGGISTGGGSFGSCGDASVSIGTPGTPRLRGW